MAEDADQLRLVVHNPDIPDSFICRCYSDGAVFLQPIANPNEVADADCFRFACESPGVSGEWIQDVRGNAFLVLGTERGEALLFDFSTETTNVITLPNTSRSTSPILCFTFVSLETPSDHTILIAGRHDGTLSAWAMHPGVQPTPVKLNGYAASDAILALRAIPAISGILLQVVTTCGHIVLLSGTSSAVGWSFEDLYCLTESATYISAKFERNMAVCCGVGLIDVFTFQEPPGLSVVKKAQFLRSDRVFSDASVVPKKKNPFLAAIDSFGGIYLKVLNLAAPNVIMPLSDDDLAEQKLPTRGVSLIVEGDSITVYDCQNWMIALSV
ncbi:hypothetical protein J8273_3126 [Carpediemonas membranifera]|uniref:Uncharacterized protein n=1 Tax=Carpediemonas membranifera TaxID=201153 RepID=A0A8J6B8T0_9EUKA|nr:hypothetical protein J8273_3126 [Carpediemonas membranifera]|eukprot:KAG9395549.1 hypothetical protein J8273_3126 [Carpediemonas membranifera]